MERYNKRSTPARNVTRSIGTPRLNLIRYAVGSRQGDEERGSPFPTKYARRYGRYFVLVHFQISNYWRRILHNGKQ